MADDNVDWRFLGRQVQILQGDVRDLRSNYLHLEGEIAGVKAELARMQADNGARFEQVENRLGRIEGEVQAGRALRRGTAGDGDEPGGRARGGAEVGVGWNEPRVRFTGH